MFADRSSHASIQFSIPTKEQYRKIERKRKKNDNSNKRQCLRLQFMQMHGNLFGERKDWRLLVDGTVVRAVVLCKLADAM